MKNTIEQNLREVKRKIEPYTPNIIAVTKYFDHTAIIDAYEAGLRDFGENRVLDAVKKIECLPDEIKANSKFHLIGHLQKNKVKKAVGNFDFIHSVDSFELALAISDEATKRGLTQKVFVQVNNAREPQKSGFYPETIEQEFAEIIKLPSLEVVGIMNMAPLLEDKDEILRLFNNVREIKIGLEERFSYNLPELSMGMSGDYEQAVKAGSTMIRLGRVLFRK